MKSNNSIIKNYHNIMLFVIFLLMTFKTSIAEDLTNRKVSLKNIATITQDDKISDDILTKDLIENTNNSDVLNTNFDRFISLSSISGKKLNSDMLIETQCKRFYLEDLDEKVLTERRYQILWWLAVSNKYMNYYDLEEREKRVNQLIELMKADLNFVKNITDRWNCLYVCFSAVYYPVPVQPEECNKSIMKLFINQTKSWPEKNRWNCMLSLGKMAYVCSELKPEIIKFFEKYCPEMKDTLHGPLRVIGSIDGISGYDCSEGGISENILFGITNLDIDTLENLVKTRFHDNLSDDLTGETALKELARRVLEDKNARAHDICLGFMKNIIQPYRILNLYVTFILSRKSCDISKWGTEKVQELIDELATIPIDKYNLISWRYDSNPKTIFEQMENQIAFYEKKEKTENSEFMQTISILRNALKNGISQVEMIMKQSGEQERAR